MAKSTRRGRFQVGVAVAVLLVATAACAPKQRIPLDIGPGPVLLFVDGELTLEIPEELELRSDRDHKIFIKRDGYTPEMVVLESTERDGREQLEPARIDVRLEQRRGDRDVLIEGDDVQ